MKIQTTIDILCRNKSKPDAVCRKLPRCKACNRVLAFRWGAMCFECDQKAKAEAQAKADPTTRRCKHCGEILTAEFADRTCTVCATTRNVKSEVRHV